MLPLWQLVRRDFALQTEQPEEWSKGARFTLVGLFEGLHFPDRRVLRILGRDVEMTGLRANAAMDAGLESEGAERTDLLCEAAHGAGTRACGVFACSGARSAENAP